MSSGSLSNCDFTGPSSEAVTAALTNKRKLNSAEREDEDEDEPTPSEGECFAFIIDLDDIENQRRPPSCSLEEWSSIIHVEESLKDLPNSVEEQLNRSSLDHTDIESIRNSFESCHPAMPLTVEDKYARRVIDHFIFCLETQPDYFGQRPHTEYTLCIRYLAPVIESFVFLFKGLIHLSWGEITSVSSSVYRNTQIDAGKRKQIGLKVDGIGYRVNNEHNEIIAFELSGPPSRLPGRHAESDRRKLSNCMIDMLNYQLKKYSSCDFMLAKELKVFGFQTKGFDCSIYATDIVGPGLYRQRTIAEFPLPTTVSDLQFLYDLLRGMFHLKDELTKSLKVIDELKKAKVRRLLAKRPVGNYISYSSLAK